MNKIPWYLEDAIKAIDPWISYKRVDERVPGIAVGITYKGKTVFTKGYGFSDLSKKKKMTPQTLFRVASNSKMFTATAIMQLSEKGKLHLDDKVQKYLPWFKSEKDKNMDKITIYNLLTHSAGIERDGDTPHWNDDNFPEIDRVKEHVREGISNYPPYERFKYSNYGFSFLGDVISVVSGKTYEEYVQENILKPIGLTNTYPDFEESLLKELSVAYDKARPGKKRTIFVNTKTNFFKSATGFVSNVEDLSKFLAAQRIGSKQLLSDESKRNMQKIHFSMVNEKDHYGIGYEIWKLERNQIIGHGGGYAGYRTRVGMNKDGEIGVVVLTNMMDGPAASILNGIFKSVIHLKNKEKKYFSSKKSTINLSKFEGRYSKRWGDSQIINVGDYLVSFWLDNTNPFEYIYKLKLKKNNEFKIISGNDMGSIGEKACFELDKKGNVKRMFIGPNPMDKVNQV